MKLIFISMVWWVNRTNVIMLLKIRENCMQNHCITQQLLPAVLFVKLPSLVLTNFFVAELRRKRVPIRSVWFQKNGVTARTTRASMDELRSFFGDRLFSWFVDTSWPPRSADLSICDYFSWGYQKARVNEHKPRTLEDLKEAMCVEVALIDRAILERVEANFQERLQKCINENGHHMKDFYFF